MYHFFYKNYQKIYEKLRIIFSVKPTGFEAK